MDLQAPGVFTFLDGLSGAQAGQLSRNVEQLGDSALWFPEVLGREPFSFAAYLLSQTERLVIATGIVVPYAYEPIVIANATRTLAELFGDRFLLGLGVSNAQANARRGIPYGKPLSFTREYLAKMKAAPYNAPAPQNDPPVVLAGMMPKMLKLAATQTNGTHTYFSVVEQIAATRKALGPEPWLCAELGVMLESDADKARSAARSYMRIYLQVDHYVQRLKEVGFAAADFANGGSDRLVDAVVAWGDAAKIRESIAAYYEAGASHVCLMPLCSEGGMNPDKRAIEVLAPN